MEVAMSNVELKNNNMLQSQLWDQALIEKYNYSGPR